MHTRRQYTTQNISERNLALISVYRLNLNSYLHQFARGILQRRFLIHFSDKVAAESKEVTTQQKFQKYLTENACED